MLAVMLMLGEWHLLTVGIGERPRSMVDRLLTGCVRLALLEESDAEGMELSVRLRVCAATREDTFEDVDVSLEETTGCFDSWRLREASLA